MYETAMRSDELDAAEANSGKKTTDGDRGDVTGTLRNAPHCFYPRDAMLWPYVCLSVSLCLSQVGVLSKRMNESS